MTNHASGLFEVKLTPQGTEEGVGDPGAGKTAIADGKHSYDFEYTLAPGGGET